MPTFKLYENMENNKDSLQFDSGALIAEYIDNDLSVRIEVVGDVRIIFDGEVYKTPSKFPQELQQIIADGNVYDDERIEVGENNWFEIIVYDNTNNAEIDMGDDPIIAVEGLTACEIKDLCISILNDVRNSIKEEN